MFIDNHSSFGVCWPRAHKYALMLSANKRAATSINYVWAVDGTLTYNWNNMWSYSHFQPRLLYSNELNGSIFESSVSRKTNATTFLGFVRNGKFREEKKKIDGNGSKEGYHGIPSLFWVFWTLCGSSRVFFTCLIVKVVGKLRNFFESPVSCGIIAENVFLEFERTQLRILFVQPAAAAYAKMKSIEKCKWNVVWLLRWIVTNIISPISKSLINQNCQVSHFDFLGVVNIPTA